MTNPFLKFVTFCGLFILATSSAVSADKPFECHVKTESGRLGLLYIHVDDISDAIKIAGSNPAYFPDGSNSPSTEVIKCKQTSKTIEFVSDEQLRKYLESSL
jgi:hypothetical protein